MTQLRRNLSRHGNCLNSRNGHVERIFVGHLGFAALGSSSSLPRSHTCQPRRLTTSLCIRLLCPLICTLVEVIVRCQLLNWEYLAHDLTGDYVGVQFVNDLVVKSRFKCLGVGSQIAAWFLPISFLCHNFKSACYLTLINPPLLFWYLIHPGL